MEAVINGFKISDLCPLNTLCDIFECQQSHPRFMAGICVNFLKGLCLSEQSCSLQHFSQKEIRKYLKLTPILGVYPFNLCKEQDKCKDRRTCRYIHRIWAEKLCIDCLNDQCEVHDESQENQSGNDHQQLITQIEQKFKINGKLPHNICSCDKQCQCPIENKNLLFLEKFCIKYFKGICKYLKSCNKVHIEWENINRNFQQFEQPQIDICSKKKWLLLDPLRVSQLQSKRTVFDSIQQRIRLSQIKQNIGQFQNFDLIIILDCTGSMVKWIQQAQDMIITSIEQFRKDFKGFFYRVGFVGFRDYVDKEKHIVFHDMTSDTQAISKFILSQKAEGGGDAAEDVIGGIQQAMKLDISKHLQSLLCTILICDSPCHGIQYHDANITDNSKMEVAEGTLEKLIQTYSQIKISNFLTCVKINDTTNIMYEVIKNNFKDAQITSFSQPDQLRDICSSSMLSTIQKSMQLEKKQVEEVFIKAIWQKPNFQQSLPEATPNDIENIWETFIKNIDCQSLKGQTTLRINVEPFKAESYVPGENSDVYTLFDTFHNKYMITKIGKYPCDEFDEIHVRKKECKVRFYSSALANQLARAYRKQQITNNVKGMPIFYVQPIFYELEVPFNGLMYLYAEPYINIDQNWTKYSNNFQFVNSSSALPVFTHFTLEATNQQMIITDLQGKANILSDPSIQSIAQFCSDYFNDLCNLQERGLDSFRNIQHKKCYQHCLQLGLKNINYDSNNQLFDFGDTKDEDKVYQICQICQEIWSSTYVKYYENFINTDGSILCHDCEEKSKKNQRSICICCEQEFQYNYLEEMTINGHHPSICANCNNKCKNVTEELNKCFYCERKCLNQLQKVKIGDKQIILCRKAIEFFSFVNCCKCDNKYKYDVLVDSINYEQQEYTCRECQKVD